MSRTPPGGRRRGYDSTATGFPAHSPLARHARRHRGRILAGDRRRPASTALAAANLGGVYPRRTKAARGTAAARRTASRTETAGADGFSSPPDAGAVLPPAPSAHQAGKAAAGRRRYALRGRHSPARALPDGTLHHRAGVVQRPGQRRWAVAQWPDEAGAGLPPDAQAGVAGYRNHRPRRTLLHRAGRLRPAAGLHAGAGQRRRCAAGFRSGILRQPPPAAGTVERVAGAPRS